jgi:phenylpropionate dioxygenase-like ring-hydroxylating dioxygenase large terminal subunit
MEVTESLADHIRNSTTDVVDEEMLVPIRDFVCSERAAREIALLKTLPMIVGHISELPNPGDFITRTVLGAHLLITHGKDGRISTFRNMCTHRGGRVEQKESGHKKIFMCQYHGWSYSGEDGSLRPLPYEESYGPVDYACAGLKRIKTEVHHGLIFIDFSNHPDRRVEDYLGPEVNAQLAPWKIAESKMFLDKTFTVPINWKLVVDGAVDSLHAQYLHPGPGNVGTRTLTNVAVFRKFGKHGRLFSPRTRLKKLIDEGSDLVSNTRHVASIMLLYPNALVAMPPDHLEFWTVWPSPNPAESTIQIRFFVRPEILTPEMEERLNKSWAVLENAATTEDWPMEEWIQENSAASPDGFFRYGRNEVSARHLQEELARDLG